MKKILLLGILSIMILGLSGLADAEDCLCSGGVSSMILVNNGPSGYIGVYDGTKIDATKLLFGPTFVAIGDTIIVNGITSSEIGIALDGIIVQTIHTSCSQPIGNYPSDTNPVWFFGDFELLSFVDGSSNECSNCLDADSDGICDIVDNCPDYYNPYETLEQCKCDNVNSLTVQYSGASAGPVEVYGKDFKNPPIATVPLNPDGTFTVSTTDLGGSFGTETTFLIGSDVGGFHTSCSQPLGPGVVDSDSGLFVMVSADLANPKDCINVYGEQGPCEPTCIDYDGDGYYRYDPVNCPSGTDCDDMDPNVNPGAEEVCNDIDDDCDGEIDEGCPGECPTPELKLTHYDVVEEGVYNFYYTLSPGGCATVQGYFFLWPLVPDFDNAIYDLPIQTLAPTLNPGQESMIVVDLTEELAEAFALDPDYVFQGIAGIPLCPGAPPQCVPPIPTRDSVLFFESGSVPEFTGMGLFLILMTVVVGYFAIFGHNKK